MIVLSGSTEKELLIKWARACIGNSVYRRNAMLKDAPRVLNCFRFTQWVWGITGIMLPDQQLLYPGAVAIPLSETEMADLVFVPRLGYKLEEDDFGHVGIAASATTVIHATKWKNGVIEEPLSEFVRFGVLGVRRITATLNCRL